MSGIPYLGSKISLISKSEIRYEGILVDVNPQESTITFEQVRFFGTEGRRPADEIAPMDRIFDCVVFRSADIKDLQVYETPAKEEEKETKTPDFPDPAVVSFASASSSSNTAAPSGFQYQSKTNTKQQQNVVADEEVKMPKANNYASAVSQPQLSHQNQQQSQSHTTKSFTTRNNRPNASNNTGNYQHSNHQQRSRGVVVPKDEFDFSQSNAKFSKDEITANIPAEVEEATSAPSYNKNVSFFDDISCQKNSDNSRVNDRNRTERNLNMETFGQAAPPRRYGHRGRGRGGSYNNSNYRGGHNNSNSYNQSRQSANNDQN